jgi:hypothetical protein
VSRPRGSGIPAGGPGQGPARGWSWQPFAAGNEVSVRHGARSPRRIDPVAAELAAALLEDRPDLAAYPEAVMAWGRAEARCLIFEDYHARVGFLDDDGNVRGGGRVAAFELQAARLRERLGLDPTSDAALSKARAEVVAAVADLEAVRERGRQVLTTRRAELAGAANNDRAKREGEGDGRR